MEYIFSSLALGCSQIVLSKSGVDLKQTLLNWKWTPHFHLISSTHFNSLLIPSTQYNLSLNLIPKLKSGNTTLMQTHWDKIVDMYICMHTHTHIKKITGNCTTLRRQKNCKNTPKEKVKNHTLQASNENE